MAKKVLVVDDEKLIVKGIRFKPGAGWNGSRLRLRRRGSTEHGQREGVRYRSSGCDAAQAQRF